jgi:hypothetical protein
METVEELKVYYNWTEENEENLRKVAWTWEGFGLGEKMQNKS